MCAEAERAFVKCLDGGCSSPVAAFAQVQGEKLLLRGLYYDEASGTYRKGKKEGPAKEAYRLGISLARELRDGLLLEKGEQL